MPLRSPLILDLDGGVLPLPQAQTLALPQWHDPLRFACRNATLDRFAAEVLAPLPAQLGTVMLGSGDFHHLSLPLLRHAGAIFLGAYTSESLGDYCAGPNHVLPTSGSARFSSPLGVYDFQKRTSIFEVSEAGAQTLGQMVIFRLLQGVFGAALVPMSQAILLDSYPREKHGSAMAIWGVGVMVGPILADELDPYKD